MKYIKNILKISLVLLLLMVCIGSIYAADDGQSALGSANDDDFDLDEDLDDDSDWDSDFDEDLDDEDDDLDDDDYLDDEDDDLDDGLDDEDDDLEEDDEDYNESDCSYSDFDFLKLKITYYLDKYGNCSSHNWTESEEFLNEYQIYLLNTSEYKLNESAEGYKTYLKIFDSITSTFGDYNLTENETEYLKFMVIFYLNHYGNISANYTWNESDDFANFTLPIYVLAAMLDTAKGSASAAKPIVSSAFYHELVGIPLVSLVEGNQTDSTNQTNIELPNYNEGNILIFLLVIVIMILMIL